MSESLFSEPEAPRFCFCPLFFSRQVTFQEGKKDVCFFFFDAILVPGTDDVVRCYADSGQICLQYVDVLGGVLVEEIVDVICPLTARIASEEESCW